jgi:NAD dependent epimerase/dehydratase family enzyme
MKEFATTLGKVLNRPALFPIPKLAVKVLKGELGDYVTDSQKVIPNKLIKSEYQFKFENLEEALKDLLK